MPLKEQKQRNLILRNRIKRYDIKKWSSNFVNTLDEIHDIYYSVFDILEHNLNHLKTYCQKELQIIQDIIDDKL